MGRIHILDEVVANQIAAGEVVERPASAVKELLENALDAGATAITVEIEEGGSRRLRIVDNGHGMDRDDLCLSIKRHATSKLRSADELTHISTLGFRGEALPSIASVSRFSIRTRQKGAVGALVLRIEGGGSAQLTEAAGPIGTEILVEDLFYNVPARRKFLKTAATESAHILEAIQRLALCAPQVAFRLIKDGRKAIDIPAHDTLRDRIRAIFGQRIAQGVMPVHVEGAFGLTGMIGPPKEARGTARHYHTFINGRYVRDRVVMSAVQAAYRGRLERGRHPFVVLHLQVPPDAIDVNVHPAKTEVRFVNSSAIHRLVARGIEATLSTEPWADVVAETPKRNYQLNPSASPAAQTDAGLDAHRRRIFDVMERVTARRGTGLGRVPSPAHQRARPVSVAPVAAELPLIEQPRPLNVCSVPISKPAPQLIRVGDLILWAKSDGVMIISVTEGVRRIAYDTIYRSPGVDLSEPLRCNLDAAMQKQWDIVAETATKIGLKTRPFGAHSVVIDALPKGVPSTAYFELITRLCAAESTPAALAWVAAGLVVEQGTHPTDLALLTALKEAQTPPPQTVRWLGHIELNALHRHLSAATDLESIP